jgi:hypothetical protein
MFSIPGQHDMPNHQLDLLHKSAYWTLVEAGKIIPVRDKCITSKLYIYGHAYGQELQRPGKSPKGTFQAPKSVLKVALVHRYIWRDKKTAYTGAPKEQKVGTLFDDLQPFNVAFFGDNHIPFDATVGSCLVRNCGGFQRRRSDEAAHCPRVVILLKDGTTCNHYLRTDDDVFAVTQPCIIPEPNMEDYLDGLRDLVYTGVCFRDAVRRFLESHNVAPGVEKFVLENLQD